MVVDTEGRVRRARRARACTVVDGAHAPRCRSAHQGPAYAGLAHMPGLLGLELPYQDSSNTNSRVGWPSRDREIAPPASSLQRLNPALIRVCNVWQLIVDDPLPHLNLLRDLSCKSSVVLGHQFR